MTKIKRVEMALKMKRAAKKRKVYLTDEGKKVLDKIVGVK
jgi:hypothetical protein